MKPRFNQPIFIITALLLVHLLFFLSALIRSPALLTDSEDYLTASQNLYSKGTLYSGDLSEPIVEEQLTRRPPIYPLILGLRSLTGSGIPLYLLQILASLLSILITYRIFVFEAVNQSELGTKLYIIPGLVMLLATPAQFIYSSRIMAEIPFQLMVVLMAWSVFHYFNGSYGQSIGKVQPKEKNHSNGKDQSIGKVPPKEKERYIWLYNLFLTIGMAIKPVLYPFALLSLLLSVFLYIKTRKPTFILALILPIFWISTYSAWNFKRTGSSQYSSIQTANMVNYNLRYFIMGREGSEVAAEEVDRLYSDCGDEVDYREKLKCLEHGVRKVILDNPVKYAFFHLKGSIRYFLDPGRFDLVTFFNIQPADSPGFLHVVNKDGLSGAIRFLKQQGWGLALILGLIAIFKLVKITGFLLYLWRGNEQFQLRIFLGFLVAYFALVTGPLGASRFLLPVELLLIGGALKGWIPIIMSLRKQS